MVSKISYITGNELKFNEAKEILGEIIEWVKIDLPEIQSLDSKEVLVAKVKEASKRKDNFIVEDISFKLRCINGLPGTLIKWFLSTLGAKGIYNLAKKYGDFSAEATCAVCYVRNKSEMFFFESTVPGKIIKPKEDSLHGWDSLFEAGDLKKSFSELTIQEKILVSPRGIALKKVKAFLESSL